MLQLRAIRKLRGFNQRQLAEELGVTQATLSGWETGKYEPDITSLKKISVILSVSLDSLILDENIDSKIYPALTNLKAIRESKGLTQKEVADDLEIGTSTLSQYETGKREPDNSTLVKIADYFNCSVDYLLGRVDSPELIIKKAPPVGDATDEYEIDKNASPLTAEEIAELRQILRDSTGK